MEFCLDGHRDDCRARRHAVCLSAADSRMDPRFRIFCAPLFAQCAKNYAFPMTAAAPKQFCGVGAEGLCEMYNVRTLEVMQ